MDHDSFEVRSIYLGAELFSRNSFPATSTRQLVEALNTTTGTFYYYYKSKTALLAAICDVSLSRITKAVESAIADAAPDDRIAAAVMTHITTVVQDIYLHKTMMTELRSLDGESASKIAVMRKHYISLIRGLIEDGQRTGLLRTDTSAHLLSMLLLNQMSWTIFWYRPDGPLTPVDIADAITRLFFEGAGNDRANESSNTAKQSARPGREELRASTSES
jgi:AcrR family transcriptional regulator